jgi:hypothetical protein
MERQSAQTPERDASQRTGVAYDLTTEGAVSTATDALGVRSRFDAALVLNKRDDIPGALIVGGLTTAYIRLDQGLIDAAVRQINGLLQRSDWDQQTFAGLDAAGTTDLLRDLAYAGRHLYETIILQFARQFAPDEIKRLQVVAAKASAQLPVEFIYERQPPSQHARLCWNAREALERGECLGSCPSDDVNPSPVICPLAFWCNSRVIEWHAYSETRASSLGNAPFAFESDNTPRGKAIRLLHNPVLGYSAKVTDADPASIGRVTGALAAGASPIQTVVRWSDWQKAIASQSPTLVILLVHCEQDGVRELIELGPEEGLTSDKNEMKASLFLTRDDFVGATAPTPPIVLLLGCSTGSSRIQFQSLASVVAARGPAIVVSTLSDIYGPRAADLAADFLRAFAATGSSATFGDVMLDVRRKSLGSGNPMVLCLRAYGDADWALESA